MGMVQSCLGPLRTFNWFQPQLVNLEQPETTDTQPKVYSWDKKKSDDTSDFLIENKDDLVLVKSPGEINGNQFIIRNCTNCHIFLLDHINTITVDDCKNCKIVIGPTKVSLASFIISKYIEVKKHKCKKLDLEP